MGKRRYEILMEVEGRIHLTDAELKDDPGAAVMQVHVDMQNVLADVYVEESRNGRPAKVKKKVVRDLYPRSRYRVLALHCMGQTYDDVAYLPTPDVRGQTPRGKVTLGELVTEWDGLKPWIARTLEEHGYEGAGR